MTHTFAIMHCSFSNVYVVQLFHVLSFYETYFDFKHGEHYIYYRTQRTLIQVHMCTKACYINYTEEKKAVLTKLRAASTTNYTVAYGGSSEKQKQRSTIINTKGKQQQTQPTYQPSKHPELMSRHTISLCPWLRATSSAAWPSSIMLLSTAPL